MRRIAVIGAGYVGLVTAACLAELGNSVICLDVDQSKIRSLASGELPFFEPGLLEMVLRNRHGGRLSFASEVSAGIAGREIIFIAVGTPAGSDGQHDLRAVRLAAEDIAAGLDGPKLVVNKSTVPTQTADLVASLINKAKTGNHAVTVVSNPEFLREGSAIADFMKPDRIVLGVNDPRAELLLRDLYAPLDAPIVVTDARTAEMIKLTANAFLAVRISFINEIANICEGAGADVKDVIAGVGSDRRIGSQYMSPGLGFGGSCIPKDLRALTQIAEKSHLPPGILHAALAVNDRQIDRVVRRLEGLLGGLTKKRIGLLGLAFKPNTDDVRESPAIALARRLLDAGAVLTAHDPVAAKNAERELGHSVRFVDASYEATHDADAIVIATDWNEYKQLDFAMLRRLMAGRLIVDLRNLYDPNNVAAEGFTYAGVGRATLAGAPAATPLVKGARPR